MDDNKDFESSPKCTSKDPCEDDDCWSDWSDSEVKTLEDCGTGNQQSAKNTLPADVTDEACYDIPLIHFTTNRTLWYRSMINKMLTRRVKRKQIGKSVKRAVRTLHNQRKTTNRKELIKLKQSKIQNIKTPRYRLRGSTVSYKNILCGDELDDSCDDETYKPNSKDDHSSDSESSTYGLTEPNCYTNKRQMADIRNVGWKRKGKKIKKRGGKRKRIALADASSSKKHKSGPWKMREKLTNNALPSSPKIARIMQKSRRDHRVRQMLLKHHSSRLDNLLTSNSVKRLPVYPDGNCFFNAVLPQIRSEENALNVEKLRLEIVNHLNANKSHYIEFLSSLLDMSESVEEKSRRYDISVNQLQQSAHWNSDLADFIPLATANTFKRTLRVYSSKIGNAVYDINPDLCDVKLAVPHAHIKVALMSITGQEHYDSVELVTTGCEITPLENIARPTTMPSSKSPRISMGTPPAHTQHLVTPRKRAQYKSPVKKQLFRKKKRQPTKWLKNIRKYNRDHGLPYTGRTGTQNVEKRVKYKNCEKCKFKCSQKISPDLANDICERYWQLGSYKMQRNFICKCVVQSETKRCTTKRKTTANAFHLPVGDSDVRVCKSFFLGVLDIGKKTVDYALKKKSLGIFMGDDARGKAPSINKTPDIDKNYIRQHIQSFPTVESHYTRKDTKRKYLNQNLSIRKMYQLYDTECKANNKKVCKISMYRQIFCNEFNLSFHKPKKDQCAICSVYNDKKENGDVSAGEEEEYTQHINNKMRSREEKERDKEKAKSDKSVVVSTFDLESVLPTPFSKIGDLYYKRCLSTYNLSVYSLGDKKGTCYLWDETNGARGSCEIGTCLLMHINSVAEKSSTVEEITYYSDTCGGQNRNQFVSSACLFALHKYKGIKTINHKFFEKGHSEMECDSIHSAIESARRETNIYLPSQWDTIVSMARKKNPYIVIPLCHSDFYDFKAFRKTVCKNMKTSKNGIRVNWLKVKWIKVTRNNPESVFLNYSFDTNQFMEIDIRSSSLRGRQTSISNFVLSPLYTKKLSISQAKKNDLLSLCKKGIIPKPYHTYYEALPSNSSIKDKLPEPDVDEEDQDTDVE